VCVCVCVCVVCVASEILHIKYQNTSHYCLYKNNKIRLSSSKYITTADDIGKVSKVIKHTQRDLSVLCTSVWCVCVCVCVCVCACVSQTMLIVDLMPCDIYLFSQVRV
jgi:hypothetical protein